MTRMTTTSTTRRSTRRLSVSVGALAAATAVALATAVMAPATVNAQSSSSAIPQLFPAQNRLVAPGGSPTGMCAGVVSTTVNPDGYPDTASVSWAVGVLGVGPCDLTATLSWHNLDTGATGQKTAHIPGPRISDGIPDPTGHPYDAIMNTGAGNIEYRLTTDGGAVAGPVVIPTPAYTD